MRWTGWPERHWPQSVERSSGWCVPQQTASQNTVTLSVIGHNLQSIILVDAFHNKLHHKTQSHCQPLCCRHHDCRTPTLALPTTWCSEIRRVAKTNTTEGQALWQLEELWGRQTSLSSVRWRRSRSLYNILHEQWYTSVQLPWFSNAPPDKLPVTQYTNQNAYIIVMHTHQQSVAGIVPKQLHLSLWEVKTGSNNKLHNCSILPHTTTAVSDFFKRDIGRKHHFK